jgi:hypothetical protein
MVGFIDMGAHDEVRDADLRQQFTPPRRNGSEAQNG